MAENSLGGKNVIEDPFSENPITFEEAKIELSDEKLSKDVDATHFEDDGEDLPDNFFDDFSNQDFMAGLDIVDDWNDDDVNDEPENLEEPSNEKSKDSKNDKSVHKSNRDKSKNERSRRRNSREDDRYGRDHYKRRSRSPHRRSRSHKRSRSRNRRSRSRNRRSRSKHTDKHRAIEKKEPEVKERSNELHGDQRRDPEKTKRDIQRDKVRCAKDIEARVFQEQLRVAETGLVPPGTELDVVLEKEKLREEAEREKTKKDNKRDTKIKVDDNKKQNVSEKRRASSRSRTDGSKPYSPTKDTSPAKDDQAETKVEPAHKEEKDPKGLRWKCMKVAETGLVPPGTELEVVEKENLKEPTPREKDKTKAGSRESDHKRNRKNEELERRSSRTRQERNRFRSPIRIIRHRSRSRSFSPKRRRRTSRSPERERRIPSSRHRNSREIDLRYRLREKREKYFSELSPVSDRHFSRSPSLYNISPQSMMSDRETWLRDRERYSRPRHSRSCSPISSNSFSDRDRGGSPRRRTKKFSFMEELEIKLKNNRVKPPPSLLVTVPNDGAYGPPPAMVPNPHEFVPQGQMQFQPNPPMFMAPGPSMCPPPEQFQNHMPMGHPDPNMIPPLMNIPINPPQMGMVPQPMMNMHGIPQGMPGMPQGVPPPNMGPFPSPVPCPVPPVTTPIVYLDPNQNPAHYAMQSNLMETHAQENKELAKLFEDKKISLSDFLSVSAKPIDPSTPVSIHNKIKVISRCQEAVKLLEEPTLTGRFFPKILPQLPEAEKRASEKTVNQSPLRKGVVVRFNFTTPVNKRAHSKLMAHPAAGVYLHKLLSMLGIYKDEKLSPDPNEEQKIPAPTPKPVPPPSSTVKKINKLSQTDHWKCEKCKIRDARKFETLSTQTIEKSTFDVGTQVSVEDLNKSCATFIPRGILKNSGSSVQSISHLTPAQLLAQMEKEKKEEIMKPWQKETFLAGRSNYGDSSQINPRTVNATSDRFNDSFRNPSFNDNYSSGDRDRFSGNFTPDNREFAQNRSFGNNPPETRNEFTPQNRPNFNNPNFGNNQPNFGNNQSNFGNNPPNENRSEYATRGPNFGSSMTDSRNFESPYNANRRFPDNNPTFGNWTSSLGRGVNRFKSPMPTNNFFSPRGSN